MVNRSLLFIGDRQKERQLVQRELNTLFSPKFTLTLQETDRILAKREEVLQENHLIDFAYGNLFGLARLLQGEQLTKNLLIERIGELEEIFYYLQTVQTSPVEDQAIIERMTAVYEQFAGDLEFMKGYFEDFPMGGLDA